MFFYRKELIRPVSVGSDDPKRRAALVEDPTATAGTSPVGQGWRGCW